MGKKWPISSIWIHLDPSSHSRIHLQGPKGQSLRSPSWVPHPTAERETSRSMIWSGKKMQNHLPGTNHDQSTYIYSLSLYIYIVVSTYIYIYSHQHEYGLSVPEFLRGCFMRVFTAENPWSMSPGKIHGKAWLPNWYSGDNWITQWTRVLPRMTAKWCWWAGRFINKFEGKDFLSGPLAMDDPVSFALPEVRKGFEYIYIYCNMLYLVYMNINNKQYIYIYIIISYIPVTRVLIQPLAFHWFQA